MPTLATTTSSAVTSTQGIILDVHLILGVAAFYHPHIMECV